MTAVKEYSVSDKIKKIETKTDYFDYEFSPKNVVYSNSKGYWVHNDYEKTRPEVFALHSRVISKFVDSNVTVNGRIEVKKMFEAADKDGGDKREVRDALQALGFKWIDFK